MRPREKMVSDIKVRRDPRGVYLLFPPLSRNQKICTNIHSMFAYAVMGMATSEMRSVHCRFTSENFCDAFKYEVDVNTGAVLSHGPMAPMEGALPMELPAVSD